MSEWPKLRTDLVSSPSEVDGQTVYTIKDPRLGNYFRLRAPEFWLISQFDGQTSPEQLAEAFKAKFQFNLSADDVRGFVGLMDKLLFLENSRAEQATSRLSQQAGRGRSRLGRLLYIKVKAFKPERFLDRLTEFYRPFHRDFWFTLQGLLALTGFWLLFGNLSHFEVELSAVWKLGSLVTLVLSLFILVSVHEFAHAVLCRLYGGEVREIGFMLMYFQPCFYCDLSDAWLFPRKSQRLAVSLAGPYMQLMLLAVSVIVWQLTVPGTFVNNLAWMLTTVNWLIFLFNFNPLIKLDGYYILSDWLDVPNLRRKAFAYLGNLLQRHLLGWDVPPVEADRRSRRIYLAYGLFALVYSVGLATWMFYLISAFLLHRFGPSGLMLFLVVLAVIMRSTLKEMMLGVATHFRQMAKLMHKPWRLTAYLIVAAVVIVVAVAVPVPRRVSGEVIVRPIAEYSLGLTDIGLLESITRTGGAAPETRSGFLQMATSDVASLKLLPLVKDGQTVREGDTVAIVSSNQINQQIETGQAELKRLQDQLVLLQAPPKKEAISEAKAQVDAARSTVLQARREYDRINSLVTGGMESRDKLESAQAALDIAEAELTNKRSALDLLVSPPRPEEEAVLQREIEKQEAHLSFLKEQVDAQQVTTPIDGTVVIGRTRGCILEVLHDREVELAVPVSDFDIPLVAVGQKVRLKVRSYPRRTFEGTVVRIPETAEANSKQARFPVAVVVDNEDGILHDGMSGYAKIETGRTSIVSLVLRRLLSVIRVEFWSWF